MAQKRGVILFRGFPVTSPSDFNDVLKAFGFPEALYVGGRASRTKVVGRIYTANESPPDKRIPFHHEMAYINSLILHIFIVSNHRLIAEEDIHSKWIQQIFSLKKI